jgi:hypothetical protein
MKQNLPKTLGATALAERKYATFVDNNQGLGVLMHTKMGFLHSSEATE